MPSKKNAKSSTTRKRRGTGPQLSGNTPNFRGDVPPRQKTDYRTESIRTPQPTGQLTFHQQAPPVRITSSATSVTTQNITFALTGLNGAATLESLFDFYRIDAVRVTVRPENTAIQLVDPSTTTLNPLYWVIDYNDATSLTGESNAQEYDNCMILSPGESAERTFQPRYSMVAKSVSGTDYINRAGDWLNVSSDDIIHYGCKFLTPQAHSGQTLLQTWLVQIEYFITFRQVQ